MKYPSRKLAFVLAASNHGPLIVSRLDYCVTDQGKGFGVGLQILEYAAFDPQEVDLALSLLQLRRTYFGDGVVAIDCGANIGVHAIEWAKTMSGWGAVIAIEAQERIFYALAGNIALNNCFNAQAVHAAVAAQNGVMAMPRPDYLQPGSLGSLELRWRANTEFIGQAINYAPEASVSVRTVALDSLGFGRVDLLKLDVEGMELEALDGAEDLLRKNHPLLLVEAIKVEKAELVRRLESLEYVVRDFGINVIAVHKADKTLEHFTKG
ncbi:MAG: FkbM family methyltransferase [Alphaproteobacteria bacterium]